MTKVSELMIPVSEYVTVPLKSTLLEVFMALNAGRRGAGRSHRDVLVADPEGRVVGKITMLEVFKALEPNYKKLVNGTTSHDALTREYVARVFRDFDLWTESLADLCGRCALMPAAEVMHEPLAGEFVDADDDLEKAVHRYVIGVRQPLLVRDKGRVAGVLRFGDLFEEVSKRMLACNA
jgi:hypothetical protein